MLEIRSRVTEGGTALSVADNGPGIAQAILDKIFDPYFSKKGSGTGLGLTLAKRIVEAHEGSITARSLPEKGAKFEILLPG